MFTSHAGGSFGLNTPLDDLRAAEEAVDLDYSLTDEPGGPSDDVFGSAVLDALSEALPEALSGLVDDVEEGVHSVTSFAAEGILTYNEGVVVRLASGAEFQVTIVRSR